MKQERSLEEFEDQTNENGLNELHHTHKLHKYCTAERWALSLKCCSRPLIQCSTACRWNLYSCRFRHLEYWLGVITSDLCTAQTCKPDQATSIPSPSLPSMTRVLFRLRHSKSHQSTLCTNQWDFVIKYIWNGFILIYHKPWRSQSVHKSSEGNYKPKQRMSFSMNKLGVIPPAFDQNYCWPESIKRRISASGFLVSHSVRRQKCSFFRA